MDLSGKRVLFIAPMFFGYEKLIKSELEDSGALVDYFNDRPDNNFLTKALIRIDRRLLAYKTNQYYDQIIESAHNVSYDHILVVRCEAISVGRIKKLKETQPKAKLKLYLWDSMHYNPNARLILPEFDQVFSFDRTDADENADMEFLPLFYGKEFERAANVTDGYIYDACFIGTIHTDRYKVLQKIIDNLESSGKKLFIYCYYPSKLLFRIRSIFDPGFRKFASKYIDFSGMKLTDVVSRIAESVAVIDVNRPGQLGLTMRSIEAVGAQRKLITTNKDITNYDIHSTESILIVNRETPVIGDSFFSNRKTPFTPAVREKYSVTAWIDAIFK
tara:strand:+ start:66 stop:1058 length:993 start_codon:yes stop_codon:yes gene_type:complete